MHLQRHPRVGKTAIVEGVAQRMAQGLPGMEAMRVVALDVGGLVAGTQYRGSFEDRVQVRCCSCYLT